MSTKEINKLFKDLNTELSKKESKMNNMTIEKFEQFEPLFQTTSDKNSKEIRVLADDFFRLINPNESLKITNNGETVLTLPPVFLPMKKIKSSKVSDTLTNSATSDNFKFKKDATDNYLVEIIASQLENEDLLNLYIESTKENMKDFYKKYKIDSKLDTDNICDILDKLT